MTQFDNYDPMQEPGPPVLPDKERSNLKLLSLFHWIIAGLQGCGSLLSGALMPLNHAKWQADMQEAMSGAQMPAGFSGAMETIYYAMMGFSLCFGFFFLVGCGLTGYFVRRGQYRWFCMVVAAVLCINCPFGTALGIYTLIVLSRPIVRDWFAWGGDVAR